MSRTFAARGAAWEAEVRGAGGPWPLGEPFRIGGVEIPNRVVQPPLAGIANWAFRAQSRRHGAGLAVSEMVSSHGVVHGNERTLRMLDTSRDTGPVAIQLFGADPAVMARAARAAADAGADLLDINMGCPVKKVCRTGAGAALLTDPDAGARVVEAMAGAVDIPVTVKMRRGMSPSTADPLGAARRFVEAGAAAITYHPRTASEEYAGRADHAHTAELVAHVAVPVIASGDIDTPAEALRVLADTGASAVAIGRPAFGNPWLYREVLTGRRAAPDDQSAVVAEIRRFADDLVAAIGGMRACADMRKFYPWYLAAFDVPAREREALMIAPTLDEALARLDRLAAGDGLQPAAGVHYRTAPSPA